MEKLLDKIAKDLGEEEEEVFGKLPSLTCPPSLKRKFYYLGIPTFPKTMKRDKVIGLISKTLNIAGEKAEIIFQNFLKEGFVYGSYLSEGFYLDRKIIQLEEFKNSSGEIFYRPYTWNPMDEETP